MTITASVRTITPGEAEEMLRLNTRNRRLSKHRVSNMARDIASGRWTLTGDAIRFNGDGTLLDGQHRLSACVEAGTPFTTLVVSGIEASAQESMDSGAKRTFGDVLRIRGESHEAMLAGAVLLGWKYETHGTMAQGGGIPYATNAERVQYLQANPNIRFSVPTGKRANESEVRYPPSGAAALHYLGTKISAPDADTFWQMVTEGTGLTANHPVQVLRALLIRDLSSSRRLGRTDLLALTIKAWNAYRSGKSVRLLLWRSTGRAAEPFPKLI